MWDDHSHSRIVAVTGSSGMIGRRVVDSLLAKGLRVRSFSRRPQLRTDVESVVGDIDDGPSLARLIADVDVVIHCAGEVHALTRMYAVNVEGTARLARLAASAGVKRFCHMSSAGVVGPASAFVIDETTPCAPFDTYERSKYEAERLLLDIAAETGMCLSILRPTNVVDALQPGLVGKLLSSGWRAPLWVGVKGGECAHLVHAMDVAAASVHLTLSEADLSGIYFVGCDEDERNTVAGIYKLLNRRQNQKSLVEYIHAPVALSHLLRFLRRGQSLHGGARFSSAKLLRSGFVPPLGLDGALNDICAAVGAVESTELDESA